MKNFKNTLSLMLFLSAINTNTVQQKNTLTNDQELDLLVALDKQKKILQTVNLLASDQILAKNLVDDYRHQVSLIKKYKTTNNPEIIKIVNEKNTEMYNSIPNIDKAIQKINSIQTAPKTNIPIGESLKDLPQLLTKKEQKPLIKIAPTISAAPKTTSITGKALESLPQLLLEQEQPISMIELQEQFAQLEKKINQELKEKEIQYKQKPSKQPSVSQEKQKELETRLAQLEIELYKKFYYNHTKELLTQEGIRDIIKTIKKDQPTIATTQLINTAHEKAIEILKNIKKQNQLDAQSKLLLLNMINNEIDNKQEATKNSPQETPIFTPALKDLETKRPMLEYHETIPTSFTSTITSIIAPIEETTETADKPVVTQEQPAPPLPENLIKFVEYSKKQAGNYYYSSGIIRQDWLTKAVGHILNGMLTKDKKENVVQKLFAMIDILIAASLRDDTSITDAEYAKIITKLEDQIKKFVDTLTVDKIYRPRN